MRHRLITTVTVTAAVWLAAADAAWATVEGQTFVANTFSLQAGSIKIRLGFLADGVVGIDIPKAPDAIGTYAEQEILPVTQVVCRFVDERGTVGWFVAVSEDIKQLIPFIADPATIRGFGFTTAPDIFWFEGLELVPEETELDLFPPFPPFPPLDAASRSSKPPRVPAKR
jgi:hypothetical protein